MKHVGIKELETKATLEDDSNMFIDDFIDDSVVKGKTSLTNIYQMCNFVVLELVGYAKNIKDFKWIIYAMKEELRIIENNQTWIFVGRPIQEKIISVKQVFKTKLNANGSINKHKVRLVIKDMLNSLVWTSYKLLHLCRT